MLLYTEPSIALNYGIVILLASVISIIYSSLMYFFSKTTEDERGKITYKNEIKAIIMNVILFIFIIVAWNGINAIASNASQGGNDNGSGIDGQGGQNGDLQLQSFLAVPIGNGGGNGNGGSNGGGTTVTVSMVSLAQSKLDDLIDRFPDRAYRMINKYLPFVGYVSSFSSSGSYSFNIKGFALKVGAGYSSSGFSVAFDKLVQFYSNAFSSISTLAGLSYLMEIFEFFSLSFFLPLGIFFRTFSYTRKLGSTMVAMAVGAGLVLPIAVYLEADVVYELMDNPNFLGITKLLNDAQSHAGALNTLRLKAITFYYYMFTFNLISTVMDPTSLILNITALSNIPIVSDVASLAYNVILFYVKTGAYGVLSLGLIDLSSFVDNVFKSQFFTYMAQALIGMTIGLVLFYFAVALTVISFIRSFSMTLGGEFFLYGVEGLI